MNRFENVTDGIAGCKSLKWCLALLLAALVAGCGGSDPILGAKISGATGPASITANMLGLAAPFGIASTAGVTNTGATTINGDAVLAGPTPTCNTAAVPGGAGTAGFGLCGGAPPTITGTVITPTFPDVTTAAAVKADMNTIVMEWTPTSPYGI